MTILSLNVVTRAEAREGSGTRENDRRRKNDCML